MKKIHRVLALLLVALMAFGLMTTAFAATDSAPIIDPRKKASLSIYKYDITKAGTEGAWDAESYVSTGLHDDAVIDKLSKYAIQGAEFTYLRIQYGAGPVSDCRNSCPRKRDQHLQSLFRKSPHDHRGRRGMELRCYRLPQESDRQSYTG